MAIGRPKAELVLSGEEQAQVSAPAGARSLPQAIVARAKLVRWAAAGESNAMIARRLGFSMPTVGKRRRRLVEQRMSGLRDELRSGRPRTYGDKQVAGLINRVLRSQRVLRSRPQNATHWSARSVTKEAGISKSTVARSFVLFGLHPIAPRASSSPSTRSSWTKCATSWDFTQSAGQRPGTVRG